MTPVSPDYEAPDTTSPGPSLAFSVLVTLAGLVAGAACSAACVVLITWYVRLCAFAASWAWHTRFWETLIR
jgi:hypothetical protein